MANVTGTFWDPLIETIARKDLEELQVERVRNCLRRMQASGTVYYHDLLSGIEPEEVHSPDDLARLPFTAKDDLREHYPFGLFLAPMRDIVRLHASSGSTGKPTVVAYTRTDLDMWAGNLARGLVAGGIGAGDVFQVAIGYGLFTGGLGFHDAATRVGTTVVPTGSGNTARQVMLMHDFGVTAFTATPSYTLHLAEVAVAEGIDPRALPLRAAFLGAEPMTEGMRKEIEERMGIAVYEQYGLSEIIGPGVASSCGQMNGMHIWEDHYVPEVVDPKSGEPLPEGEVGELVLSAPTKEAFPILRYRTRDLTWMTREPCPCGRNFARIGKIVGRTDDMMIVRGVNVFPSQIEHALLGVEGLAPHYQIMLSTRDDRQTELRVRVETSTPEHAASGALEKRAEGALKDALALSVPVELAPPGTVPRSEGKAVRIMRRQAQGGP